MPRAPARPGLPDLVEEGGAGGRRASSPRLAGCPACPGAGGADAAAMPGVQARWDGRARWLDGSIAAEGGTLQPTSLAAYLDRVCGLPGTHAGPAGSDSAIRCSHHRNKCSQFQRLSRAVLGHFLAVALSTDHSLITTSTPTVMGTSTPTVMGPQATVYLWVPAKVPFALVRWLSGAESRAKTARDSAPLRYVGVPPTCQLGRTRTLCEGIQVETGSPAPVGR